jgi:hypothetical protein
MKNNKTLKDLRIERGMRVGIKNPNDCLIDPDELKVEAIKWAKDPNKLRRNWFKNFLEFHNITKEDLK